MSFCKITIQNESKAKNIPKKEDFKKWITAALAGEISPGRINIRLVDEDESSRLNEHYRNKSGPTNVLAFPYYENEAGYLGDLVICAPLVRQEAKLQDKELIAHWAHLVIHGTLHLLGYDHMNDEEALEMEQLEITLLTRLNYANPY